MRKAVAAVLMGSALTTGCAGPQLATSPTSSSDEAEAGKAMRSEPLPPELRARTVIASASPVFDQSVRKAVLAASPLSPPPGRSQFDRALVLACPT